MTGQEGRERKGLKLRDGEGHVGKDRRKEIERNRLKHSHRTHVGITQSHGPPFFRTSRAYRD